MKPTIKTMGVIILPTDKASHIHLASPTDEFGDNYEKDDNGNLKPLTQDKLLYTKEATKYGFPPQHLYIVSDAEIKEGDWVYYIKDNKVGKISNYIVRDWIKKIEATTDTSLNFSDKGSTLLNHSRYGINGKEGICDIPQIPTSFLEAYVKAEGKITEVQVEMIIGQGMENGEMTSIKEWIKTNENNEIIIHLNEENKYSKDEILDFLCDNFLDIRNTIPDAKLAFKKEYFNNLLKNLEEYGK